MALIRTLPMLVVLRELARFKKTSFPTSVAYHSLLVSGDIVLRLGIR